MTDAEKFTHYLRAVRKDTWRTFPAATGDIVQEGNAKWCADYGHSKWYRLNESNQHALVSQCPNCGDDVWDANGEYTRVSLVKV